jgi:hypothetical protein
MRSERSVPGGEDGRHDTKLERVCRAGDGIDASVHPEQDPDPDPPTDVVLAVPETDELADRHQSVLSSGEPEEGGVVHGQHPTRTSSSAACEFRG